MAETRILVVDDDSFVRDMLAFILEEEGYLLETAEHGLDALAKCLDDRFDLIVSDMNMPEMGGVELLEQLRDREVGTPVVILSGSNEMSEAAEAVRKGACHFLVKDENIQDTIAESVRGILEKIGAERL